MCRHTSHSLAARMMLRGSVVARCFRLATGRGSRVMMSAPALRRGLADVSIFWLFFDTSRQHVDWIDTLTRGRPRLHGHPVRHRHDP